MENVFRRYWTESEQSRLLAKVRSFSSLLARRDAAWLQALIATGFRVGEFSRLTCGDAEAALESRWLFIPKEIRKGGQVDHAVPVTKPIEESLRALLRIHREMGGTGEADRPLVTSRKHKAMSVRSYQARVALWCAQAGLEGTPHFARHTRAMNIKRRSTSNDWMGIAQGALGHASRESTGIYTRVSKEDLQRELEVVDGAPTVRKHELRRRYEERRTS